MNTSGANLSTKIKPFIIKKYNRNGLLEKKHMKRFKLMKSGKWTPEENKKFIRASLRHGVNWRKLKEEIGTRTHAQIRSHAQKYFIKLCKKYDIEIKSKRKESFTLSHLNFPYKRRSNKSVVPLSRITRTDLCLIKKFNFYIKQADLETCPTKEFIFKIEKVRPRTNLKKAESHSASPKETLSESLSRKEDSLVEAREAPSQDMNDCSQFINALEELVNFNKHFISTINVSNNDVYDCYNNLCILQKFQNNFS